MHTTARSYWGILGRGRQPDLLFRFEALDQWRVKSQCSEDPVKQLPTWGKQVAQRSFGHSKKLPRLYLWRSKKAVFLARDDSALGHPARRRMCRSCTCDYLYLCSYSTDACRSLRSLFLRLENAFCNYVTLYF